jgi:hypothetical protein
LYNALTLPFLLCGSEIWTLWLKRDIKPLTSTEIKVFGRTAGHTSFYNKRNEEILEEFEVEPVD